MCIRDRDYKGMIFILKELATNTSRAAADSVETFIIVEHNVVNWTPELRSDIDVQVENIRRSIFHAQMTVNRV